MNDDYATVLGRILKYEWPNLQLLTTFIQFHIILTAVPQIPQLLATAQAVHLMKFNMP